jgi:hypothetical protein
VSAAALGREETVRRQREGFPLNRRTGRTTRLLLRMILAASEEGDTHHAVVATGSHHAGWLFDRLLELATPVGGGAGLLKTDRADRIVRLPNGSVIHVLHDLRRTEGTSFASVVEDLT